MTTARELLSLIEDLDLPVVHRDRKTGAERNVRLEETTIPDMFRCWTFPKRVFFTDKDGNKGMTWTKAIVLRNVHLSGLHLNKRLGRVEVR